MVQDDKEAVKWWRKAADQGHADAQYILGLCYACGRNVVQDFGEAYFWLLIAAANGDEKAFGNRDDVANQLSQKKREQIQARARKWLRSTE